MSKPISVQLYSLRDQMKDGNHLDVLKKVAAMGYTGVEPAGFYGLTPGEFRKVVEDLGMTISSNHGPMPTAQNKKEIIHTYSELGTQWVVSGFGPDDFATHEAISKTISRTKDALGALAGTDFKFVLHNHWWEFEVLDGKFKIDYLLDACPEVLLEIDTYWASNFGANDPSKIVAKYKAITPLLHIKDGPLVRNEPHTAAGGGKMNFREVIAAAHPDVHQWSVVELDACGTDMVQAVADSYSYLVGQGFASGRK